MDEDSEKPPHEVVLTERKAVAQVNPVIWLALLAVPFVFGLMIALGQDNDALLEPAAQLERPKQESGAAGRGGKAVSTTNAIINPVPVQKAQAAYKCDFAPWVGMKVQPDMLDALKGTGNNDGRPYRVLEPGSAMTMDHNPARVNFDLNEAGLITRIWCG